MKYNIIEDSISREKSDSQKDFDITKEELFEIIQIKKRTIQRLEKEIESLKSKHPRLHKERLNDLKSAKNSLEYAEERYKNFDIEKQKELEESIKVKEVSRSEPFEKIDLPNTISFSSKISEVERKTDHLNWLQYYTIIRMAKSNGNLHAIQMASEQKRKRIKWGLSPWSSLDDYNLWEPLVSNGFVEIKQQNPTESQKAFFSKSRSGEYLNKGKGMSGYEPTTYSINSYILSEKGWEKANTIRNLILTNSNLA